MENFLLNLVNGFATILIDGIWYISIFWLINWISVDRHETNHGMSQLVSDNDSFVYIFSSFCLFPPEKSCPIHFKLRLCRNEWCRTEYTQIKRCRFVFDRSHLTSIEFMLIPCLSARIMNDCHQLTKCLLHPVIDRFVQFETKPDNLKHSVVQIDLNFFISK